MPDLGAELIKGLITSICLTIEVFIHDNFGSRYVGSGFMGLVAIFLFSLMFNVQDIGPLYYFAWVYGIVWGISLTRMLIRYWRGRDKLHSMYTGRPLLLRLLPSWREEYVKHLEAVLVILLGFAVHHLSKPLGDYIMVAASLVFLRGYGIESQQRNRAVEMNDRVIEQKQVAERFRATQEP